MNDKNMGLINAKITEKSILVELPIELLIFACENNGGENSYKILDREKFVKLVAEKIIDGCFDSEEGLTGLQNLLDRIFEEIFVEEEDIIEQKEF